MIEKLIFCGNYLVIAQLNEWVDDRTDLPRVDIPGSWMDFVVVADQPFFIELYLWENTGHSTTV